MFINVVTVFSSIYFVQHHTVFFYELENGTDQHNLMSWCRSPVPHSQYTPRAQSKS